MEDKVVNGRNYYGKNSPEPLTWESFSQKTSDTIQKATRGDRCIMITTLIVGYFVSSCVVIFGLWSSDLERVDERPPFGVQVGGAGRIKPLMFHNLHRAPSKPEDGFKEKPVIPLRKQHMAEDQ